MKKLTYTVWILFLALNLGLAQGEPVHQEVNALIRTEALEQSEVMELASWMTDVYGPRLTGSPNLAKAKGWAMEQLEEWGWQNVREEAWGPFGRGWDVEYFEFSGLEPSYFPIIAYPRVWSPSTDGPVEGEVIYLDAGNEEELAAYKGKLRGKFVLLDTARQVKEWEEPLAKRWTSEELLEMANAGMPTPRGRRDWQGSGVRFSTLLWEFIYEEQPLAVLDRSYKGDLGTVFVSRARAREGSAQDVDAEVLPQLTVGIEYYNRIFRLLQKDVPVRLRLNIKATYPTNPDGMESNVIAEWPGTDLADEIVIFGAHYDSWQAGTGATDNAAGSAVMMEVARVLSEVIRESGTQPRRTLRIALWTGEEQGLLGSRAYVREHFADTDRYGNPFELKPAQENVSAYYNLDNGTGKVRGIYLQGNQEAAPIFRAWLNPWKDLDAATITLSNTGGTDHLSFDGVGIPGFQFIQDPMAYWARTHHSNMDNWDHLVADDLMQASAVISSFVFHTAQRDEKIPRKPLVINE